MFFKAHLFPLQQFNADLQGLQRGFGFGCIHCHWSSLSRHFESIITDGHVVPISLGLGLQYLPGSSDVKGPSMLQSVLVLHRHRSMWWQVGGFIGRIFVIFPLSTMNFAFVFGSDGVPGFIFVKYGGAGWVWWNWSRGRRRHSQLLLLSILPITILSSIPAQCFHLLKLHLDFYIVITHNAPVLRVSVQGRPQ